MRILYVLVGLAFLLAGCAAPPTLGPESKSSVPTSVAASAAGPSTSAQSAPEAQTRLPAPSPGPCPVHAPNLPRITVSPLLNLAGDALADLVAAVLGDAIVGHVDPHYGQRTNDTFQGNLYMTHYGSLMVGATGDADVAAWYTGLVSAGRDPQSVLKPLVDQLAYGMSVDLFAYGASSNTTFWATQTLGGYGVVGAQIEYEGPSDPTDLNSRATWVIGRGYDLTGHRIGVEEPQALAIGLAHARCLAAQKGWTVPDPGHLAFKPKEVSIADGRLVFYETYPFKGLECPSGYTGPGVSVVVSAETGDVVTASADYECGISWAEE